MGIPPELGALPTTTPPTQYAWPSTRKHAPVYAMLPAQACRTLNHEGKLASQHVSHVGTQPYLARRYRSLDMLALPDIQASSARVLKCTVDLSKVDAYLLTRNF